MIHEKYLHMDWTGYYYWVLDPLITVIHQKSPTSTWLLPELYQGSPHTGLQKLEHGLPIILWDLPYLAPTKNWIGSIGTCGRMNHQCPKLIKIEGHQCPFGIPSVLSLPAKKTTTKPLYSWTNGTLGHWQGLKIRSPSFNLKGMMNPRRPYPTWLCQQLATEAMTI